MKDRDVLLALDREGVGMSAQIDRKPAAARGLAADRAVTAEIGHRRIRLALEVDGVAVAGAFEVHGLIHFEHRNYDCIDL